MLSQVKSKKAVSPMIAYIILVTIVIVMAPFVYSWLKSYASEGEVPECPDDVALLIKNVECYKDSSTNEWKLKVELQNNGLFDIDGYSIKATTSSEQELATYNLAVFYEGDSKEKGDGAIIYPISAESNSPTNTIIHIFKINEAKDQTNNQIQQFYTIEITPRKVIEINNKEKWAYCDDARVKQEINCQRS